jgi:hypothetical protein
LTATKGTLFYRRQRSAAEIIKALAQLAEGNWISSITRTTAHAETAAIRLAIPANGQTS